MIPVGMVGSATPWPKGSLPAWRGPEVLNEFAGETVDPTLLAHGLQAFLEYMPIRPDAADPRQLFRRFRCGRAVDLFIRDERQDRSAERFCVRDGHNAS
jgi:phosphodiesterase/alkaline phosphatase D-like protein